MSKYRRMAKVDSNQNEIVDLLRKIPNVSVEKGHDDILVGHKGHNYWIEIKNPDTVSNVTGRVRESAIKISQKSLRDNWKGNYHIVSSYHEILKILGIPHP